MPALSYRLRRQFPTRGPGQRQRLVRPMVGLALGLAAGLTMTLCGLAAWAQDDPQRVVSLNLCADQLAVLLLPPERIAALSVLSRDRGLSWVADQADDLPQVAPHAESVLALNPDLVLAGRYTARAAVGFLKSRGLPVFEVDLLSDFDGIRRQTRAVARRLGASARGEALLAEMDAILAGSESDRGPAATAAVAARPLALTWQPGGFTAGAGTLIDAVLHSAGYDNMASRHGLKGYGYLTLETVVAGRPDLLVSDQSLPDRPSLRQALLTHPALAPGPAGIGRRVALPAPLTACAGPFTARAVAILRQIHQSQPPVAAPPIATPPVSTPPRQADPS